MASSCNISTKIVEFCSTQRLIHVWISVIDKYRVGASSKIKGMCRGRSQTPSESGVVRRVEVNDQVAMWLCGQVVDVEVSHTQAYN